MTKRRVSHLELIVVGALSAATALAADAVLDHFVFASRAVRLAIAVLPLPVFILFIVAEFRWIRDQDEFHRRVMLDSLAIAFPLAIAALVLLEALQTAGFLTGLMIGDVWPFIALTWLPSMWIAARRYR